MHIKSLMKWSNNTKEKELTLILSPMEESSLVALWFNQKEPTLPRIWSITVILWSFKFLQIWNDYTRLRGRRNRGGVFFDLFVPCFLRTRLLNCKLRRQYSAGDQNARNKNKTKLIVPIIVIDFGIIIKFLQNQW